MLEELKSIFNYLIEIPTKGQDTVYMGQALLKLDKIIKSLPEEKKEE